MSKIEYTRAYDIAIRQGSDLAPIAKLLAQSEKAREYRERTNPETIAKIAALLLLK